MKPFRLYLSPTLGRSCDIPEQYRLLTNSEECFYSNLVSQEQIMRADPDIPGSYFDSYENGIDKYTETIETINGPETFYAWDFKSIRYFVELESLEDLDVFILCLDVPLTLVRRDPNNQFQCDFLETIYGTPLVSDCMVGEIETVIPPNIGEMEREEEEYEDGEAWKRGG